MEIEAYSGKYDGEIVSLILGIQNQEAGIGRSLRSSRTSRMSGAAIRTVAASSGWRCWTAGWSGRWD